MNAVFLIGRLTRAPELRYTPNKVAVGHFTLAVDRPFVNQDGEREADFIPIVVWRSLAETCAKHLQKGRLVAVQGRLQTKTWEDREGRRRWSAEVVADRVEFLDWGKAGRQEQAERDAPSAEYDGGSEVGTEVEDNDVPF